MQSEGRHLVADFWGCQLPGTEDAWRRVIGAAVDAMGVTLLSLHVHLFEPRGATAVAILAESHLAIHTWPERDYVAIDVFTCGDALRPNVGIDVLRSELCPRRERVLPIPRGVFDATDNDAAAELEHADPVRPFPNPDGAPACR